MRCCPGPSSGSGRSSASSRTSGPPHSLITTPRIAAGLWAQTLEEQVEGGVRAALLDHAGVARVDQQAVEHGACEYVDQELDVEVRAQFPALDGAAEHGPYDLAA